MKLEYLKQEINAYFNACKCVKNDKIDKVELIKRLQDNINIIIDTHIEKEKEDQKE